jgi:hypothetical protein
MDKTGELPTDEMLQLEGCRIIFASEILSLRGISSTDSWLRDLIMSSDDLSLKARVGPLRGPAENRLAKLKINGKDNLFEDCALEKQLSEFVKTKRLLGLTAMDDELQEEACIIVGRIEEVSTTPSDIIANWLVRMIITSTKWLANFRQRAHLPRSEEIADEHERSTDPTTIDSTIYNYSRLERELAVYTESQRVLGLEPSDNDLQRQARIIIYEFDDGWNQTAADNIDWLNAFKQRHLPSLASQSSTSSSLSSTGFDKCPRVPSMASVAPLAGTTLQVARHSNPARNSTEPRILKTAPFFLNDANCYRRLERELSRYVTLTMSPNNPNQHVPTDDELRHQARWILYDE